MCKLTSDASLRKEKQNLPIYNKSWPIFRFGVDVAFIALALMLFLLQCIGGLFIKMPELTVSHTEELMHSYRSLKAYSRTTSRLMKSVPEVAEYNPLLGSEVKTGELVKSREFLLFWVAAFTGIGPGKIPKN